MREFLATIIILLSAACTRRPLYDEVCSAKRDVALIPVKIDWSISGITPSKSSSSAEYVHRVSLRFFPKDGGEVVERYLEDNVYEGVIELSVGEYSVVAYNESIDDPYWNGVFNFVNVDDYDNFMAQLADEDEGYSSEAYKLASWSLDDYVVTPSMATVSYTSRSGVKLSTLEDDMLSALEGVVMQLLTCYVNVSAAITNLSSAQSVTCDVQGFSGSVYMASGESHPSQALHTMELTQREYTDDESKHGTISDERLILTRSTHEDASLKLTFEVYLRNGSIHTPEEPLEFDVDHQATRYATEYFNLSAQFELPETSSGIDVDGWEDEEVLTIY